MKLSAVFALGLAALVLMSAPAMSDSATPDPEDDRSMDQGNDPVEVNIKLGLFVKSSSNHRPISCAPFNCEQKCLFGWALDGFGCPTCQCVEDGKEQLFEGDIQVTQSLRDFIQENYEGGDRKGTQTQTYGRWPGATVPYTISSSMSSAGRTAIEAAINEYHKHTCIKFFQHTNQPNYVKFYHGGGCSSPVGMQGGANSISLGQGCHSKVIAMHEIGHTLGMFHENSRPDRDSYVRINYQNISPSVRYNFNKQSTNMINSRGTPYDLASMMHFSSTAFSSNGRMTITTVRGELIDRLPGFSPGDIQKLNGMYNCNGGSGGGGGGSGSGGTGSGGGGGSCEDGNANCAGWAARGECEKNPGYMLKNCKKSCNKCGGGGGGDSSCKDANSSCPGWKGLGYCSSDNKYYPYMKQNCMKSCDLCG